MSGATVDAVTLEQISRDWSHRRQSWTLASVFTFSSFSSRGSVLVEIEADAYDFQSHAKLSVWSDANGWMFHTSIPTEQWYRRTPSYTKKQDKWTDDEFTVFTDVEQQLLDRFTSTFFSGREVLLEVP